MASRRLRSFLRGLPALLLLLLFLLEPWPAASHGGKYSREKNQPEPPPKRESGEEFRMEKLNQLWEKAQRVSATQGRRPWLGAVERGPGVRGGAGASQPGHLCPTRLVLGTASPRRQVGRPDPFCSRKGTRAGGDDAWSRLRPAPRGSVSPSPAWAAC